MRPLWLDALIAAAIGLVSGAVVVVLSLTVAGSVELRMWLNDFIRAVGEFLGAIAWPVVALIFVYIYRARIGELLPRIRELLGAKFDAQASVQVNAEPRNPVEQAQSLASAAAAIAPGVAAAGGQGAPDPLPAGIERMRTMTVVETEGSLLAFPAIAQIQNPQTRLRALSTIASALAVINTFERAESVIWRSQIELLEFLNATPQGAPRDLLKQNFYDPAVARNGEWFANQPFDNYLGYLASHHFIAFPDAGTVTITEAGREYLVWRVTQRKLAKLVG
jgi:hypothetical protein